MISKANHQFHFYGACEETQKKKETENLGKKEKENIENGMTKKIIPRFCCQFQFVQPEKAIILQ